MVKTINDIIQALASVIASLAVLIPLLLPIIKATCQLIASKSSNQKVKLLNERALVIVQAMETTDYDGANKHKNAVFQLSQYCEQVGIKMSVEQINTYIDSAVFLLQRSNQL